MQIQNKQHVCPPWLLYGEYHLQTTTCDMANHSKQQTCVSTAVVEFAIIRNYNIWYGKLKQTHEVCPHQLLHLQNYLQTTTCNTSNPKHMQTWGYTSVVKCTILFANYHIWYCNFNKQTCVSTYCKLQHLVLQIKNTQNLCPQQFLNEQYYLQTTM